MEFNEDGQIDGFTPTRRSADSHDWQHLKSMRSTIYCNIAIADVDAAPEIRWIQMDECRPIYVR
jgi:hypothetical protein